jgi:phospholipid/cholesterol/gamma-HCH transport system ATP-binding protein
VTAGEALTILGPSGTGKTVIFKLIMGFLFPTSGTVNVLGIDTNTATEDQLVDLRKQVGILFQGAALFDSLDVYENIAYPLRERGETNEDIIRDVVKHRLQIVDLAGQERKLPSQLSGGQKKRIGLARALATEPKVMLFDEPTTGLDPTAVRLIDDLIIRLREELQITSLVVTHDIPSAQRISTRWMLFRNGYKIADGEPTALAQENPEVQRFITGHANDD